MNGGDPLTAPGATLRVVPLTTRDPRKMLDEESCDVAVGYFPSVVPDLTARAQNEQPVAFGSQRIYDGEYVCVMRAGHPLAGELWLRDAAPSTELRRWFNHDPERWAEFARRYRAELDDRPETVRQLLALAADRGLTLLYSARDREHNQAAALRDYLLTCTPPSKGEDHGSD